MSKKSQLSYCQQRLQAIGWTESDNEIYTRDLQIDRTGTDSFFSSDKDDNIIINYYDKKGVMIYYEIPKTNKIKRYTRTRYKVPVIKDGKQTRYHQDYHSGVFPWLSPGIIKKTAANEDIPDLYIIEGEIKAAAGYKLGFDFIGLGGKDNFKEGKLYKLNNDIVDIIVERNTKNLFICLDGDLFDLPENWKEKDLALRPYSFFSTIKNFIEVCKPIDINIYLCHVIPGIEKGLDDIIINKHNDVDVLIKEIKNYAVDNQSRKFWRCFNVTDMSVKKLKNFFHIDTIENFYNFYKDTILNEEFTWFGNKSYFDENEAKLIGTFFADAKNYIAVGTNYYKKIVDITPEGRFEVILKDWNEKTILRDFNNNRVVFKNIETFDSFTNIPDNTSNYKQIHYVEHDFLKSKLYNRYEKNTHIMKEGPWDNINKFLKHIFSSENIKGDGLYEFGLDWIQICFYNPIQRLPVLCLVSKIKNTGKSKFLDFLNLIFGYNMVILDNERFTGKFTSHFIDKLVIGLDESFIPMEQKIMKERIKNLSIGTTQWLEEKGRPAHKINCYSKLVLCSNEENNFMQMDADENRFCVLKIPKIEGQVDPFLLQKMRDEIPAFLYFLQQRCLFYPIGISRFSFDTDVYLTAQFQRIAKKTTVTIERTIIDFLREMFLLTKQSLLQYTPQDILDLINPNITFKLSKIQVKDFLEMDLELKPLPSGKYTLFRQNNAVISPEILEDSFSPFISERKAGRFFEFHVSGFLNEAEMSEITKSPDSSIPEQLSFPTNDSTPF